MFREAVQYHGAGSRKNDLSLTYDLWPHSRIRSTIRSISQSLNVLCSGRREVHEPSIIACEVGGELQTPYFQ